MKVNKFRQLKIFAMLQKSPECVIWIYNDGILIKLLKCVINLHIQAVMETRIILKAKLTVDKHVMQKK